MQDSSKISKYVKLLFIIYLTHCLISIVRDVVISPAEPEFIEGANLLLNCTVDGTTDQTVAWSVNKAGTPEPLLEGDDASHVQVFNNGSLIIRILTPADAGVYICTHEFDEASKSAMVNVGGKMAFRHNS